MPVAGSVRSIMVSSHHIAAAFRDVTKRFGETAILEDFSLEVAGGEFVSIIGPSGCGKTTLLRLLAGLTEPSGGEITQEGQAGRSAYIFQDATLLPWRTALRNVELPLQLAGVSRDERRQRAEELLKLVGLSDATLKYPRQLSGGMKMRVSLARGLALQPSLMLLDEPFGALDAMTRNRLNEELLDLRERQPFTALFVTHSVSEAVFLSNRIVVMSGQPGRIAVVETIDFPYPRKSALREQPEYYEKVAKVTGLLHQAEEVVA